MAKVCYDNVTAVIFGVFLAAKVLNECVHHRRRRIILLMLSCFATKWKITGENGKLDERL